MFLVINDFLQALREKGSGGNERRLVQITGQGQLPVGTVPIQNVHQVAHLRHAIGMSSTDGQPKQSEASNLAQNDTSRRPSTDETDDRAVDFLLTTLSDATPMFTEEDMAREINGLTEEERVDILADQFGRELNLGQRSKKLKSEEKPEVSEHDLLKSMETSIEEMPLADKQAYLEAKSKAPQSELSEDRMKLFILREDMDAKVRLGPYLFARCVESDSY